jgi:hypothetical protein
MRIVTIVLATLAGLAACSGASARVPNMTCTAIGSVASGATAADRVQMTARTTDVFRFQNGKLYHRWSGRDEYFYNDVVEVEIGRYASGHMLFVMDGSGDRKGYVMIAASTDWRVVYIDCKP